VITSNAQQSGEKVRGLRMHIANAPTVASRATPAAPRALEDRGQRTGDSQLPEHFRFGLSSVERLDSSTPQGNTTTAHHLSQ
jgi:hypothetical protein